ncbi:MAG: DUF3810 family protein [Erysipelotrichales bacterium]|nr:DUF3810 family protein [Erysipelotrichales bacterium]
MYLSNTYAYYFTLFVINNINGFFYYFNSHINYFSFIVYGFYFISLIIYIVIDIYYELISKAEYESRSKIVNKIYRIFVILTLCILIPSLLSQFSNHLPNFDRLYFKETKDKTYTKEDLIELNLYLKDIIDDISSTIKRDKNNEIAIDINYNKQAIKDLKNISNEIALLKGLYPKKSSKINNLMRGILGSKVVGFTTPYNTYFDYDASKTSIISTITHEFCHTKGILRENETVYCSFLAGIKSDNQLSNYAAYLDAFSWSSAALLEIDYETADQIEDQILSKCLTNDYKELCDSYTKNNEEYIKGSTVLKVASYRLKNYQEHKEELKESLTLLKENNARITVLNEELSIDQILKLVDDNSEARVGIEVELNEKVFNKIKDAIKDKSLYLSIYQKNKEDKESSDKKEDSTKYYLAPFKDKDEHIIFNISYSNVEYEYSRVARLLLEYYEKNKLN